MESNQTFNAAAFIEVRKELTTRLIRTWSFTEADLAPRSIYQLVTVIHLLAGHRNYVGQHTTTCYALERIFGDAFYEPLISPKVDGETEAESNQRLSTEEHETGETHSDHNSTIGCELKRSA